MKIFFEDGKLRSLLSPKQYSSSGSNDEILGLNYIIANVDAGSGCSKVISNLEKCLSIDKRTNVAVYTNSILALEPQYTWDKILGKHEVYFRSPYGWWVHVDELTNRDLHKEIYKISKMYMSGEFDERLGR